MSKSDLVTLLANTITGLDQALMSSTLLNDPPKWHLVYALRKHLDDEQRQLLVSLLDEEDAAYQALTATIQAAADSLQEVLASTERVDEVVLYVTKICADVDQILKLVP